MVKNIKLLSKKGRRGKDFGVLEPSPIHPNHFFKKICFRFSTPVWPRSGLWPALGLKTSFVFWSTDTALHHRTEPSTADGQGCSAGHCLGSQPQGKFGGVQIPCVQGGDPSPTFPFQLPTFPKAATPCPHQTLLVLRGLEEDADAARLHLLPVCGGKGKGARLGEFPVQHML